MSPSSLRVPVAVLLAAAVCAVVLLRNPAGDGQRPPPADDPVRAGRERYATFAAADLEALDRGSFIAILRRAVIDPSDGYTAADLDQVLAGTAEFIHVRFLQDSPTVYQQWRERNGYVPRSPEIIQGSGVEHNWRIWTGRTEDRPSFDELVEGSFSQSVNDAGGRARPTRIATDPQSLAVQFYREDRRSPPPLLKGGLGAELWHGRISASMMNLWEPPQSRRALLASPGSVRCARVGLIIEGQTGDRHPWLFTWLQDPTDKRWRLSWVNIQNYEGHLPMIVY